MEEASLADQGDDLMDLPPGFRFHPTDEEIISYYLTERVMNSSFSARAIGEVDLNKCEPWDLPKKAKMGEKEWYFFCQRDRKYPTGMRTNRATESGYWKATGKDKEIYKGKGCLVGMKKTLVFYRGRAPKGEKSNWVMHEYRLEGKFSYYNLPKAAKDEWVVCRVFHKSAGIKRSLIPAPIRMNSFGDDLLDCSSLPPLIDPPYSNPNKNDSCFTNGEDEFKGSSTRFSDGNHHYPYFSPTINGHQLQKQQDQKSFLLSPNNVHTTSNYQATLSNPTPNSIFYPQVSPSNPLFPFQASPTPSYSHWQMGSSFTSFPGSGFKGSDPTSTVRAQTSGVQRQCKVEQFSSNQSMVSLSQDTGLSTDMNTEISSVLSKHQDTGNNRSYEDLQGPLVGQIGDLDYLLDY